MTTPTALAVPIDQVRADPELWPRRCLEQERVALFAGLYRDGDLGALPALDVVAHEGAYLLADGWHRLAALRALHSRQVPVRLISSAGLPAGEAAWRHGVSTASTTARPLSRAERSKAVDRLLAEDVSLADREIARLVGVSPTTVGAHRSRLAGEPATAGAGEQAELQYLSSATADQLARRLSRSLHRLYDERGLGDRFLGDRTGKRLAAALVDLHGPDEALAWADRLQSWAAVAIEELGG